VEEAGPQGRCHGGHRVQGKIAGAAEQYGWPLLSAKGYVDGETFRKWRKEPPLYPLVGIDDYSEGFRPVYFHRSISEQALAGKPSAQSGLEFLPRFGEGFPQDS